MEKNINIEYKDPLKQSFSDLSELYKSIAFVSDVEVSGSLQKNIEITSIQAESTTRRRSTSIGKSTQQGLEIMCTFPLSIQLLTLLRTPRISGKSFQLEYLQDLLSSLPEPKKLIDYPHYTDLIIYVHLILSRVINIESLHKGKTETKPFKINPDIEKTNILNAKCIGENLRRLNSSEKQ